MKQIKFGLLAFVGGLAGAYAFYLLAPATGHTFIERENSPYQLTSNHSVPMTGDFVKASSASTHSVVYIKTISQSVNSNNFFDFFFNGQQSSTSISSGSGVIFSADGYIVTNSHVINKAKQIEVIHNKRSYIGKVIGTDPSTDLAVVKIDAKDLPPVQIGSSKNLQVGEWVLAVGNPFNLTSTVTAGIVSAKARDIHVVNGRFPLESFIQTDAAINPGNSGGALVNTQGELVGINTAILSQTGSYSGYGFAVPVDIVKKIVKDLIQYGEVQQAFVGFEIADLNTELGQKLKTDDLDGVVITLLRKDSNAEKAGLKIGDIVYKIDDEIVDSRAMFNELIGYRTPGDKIKITYKRGDKTADATITLTNENGGTGVIKHEIYNAEKINAELESISTLEKEKLGVVSGVRIVSNINGNLLSRLGMNEGFIITAVNGVRMTNPQDLEDVISKIRGRVVIEGVNAEGSKGTYSYYLN